MAVFRLHESGFGCNVALLLGVEIVMSNRNKIGNNDPCPCGALKSDGRPVKFKKCCRDRKEPPPWFIQRMNRKILDEDKKDHEKFLENHGKGICDTCLLLYSSFDATSPCLHWLLRPDGVKKEHISVVLIKFGYARSSAYIKWIANTVVFGKNINNLADEQGNDKVIEQTIKYKNFEWSFSCSKSDYAGHLGSSYGREPHFHFQMKIDDKPFVNYGNFHVPFLEYDIFSIKAENGEISNVQYVERYGAGMKEMIDFLPKDDPVDGMKMTEDMSKAQYNLQTCVTAAHGKTISGREIYELYEESKRTGIPMAKLFRRIEGASVNTYISPGPEVPEKAIRTPRNRGKNKPNAGHRLI